VARQNKFVLHNHSMTANKDFQFSAPSIVFHGEQKGAIEDEIKARWKKTLSELPNISEAYLAIVDFNSEQKPHPVLCLYPAPQEPQPIIERLSADFKEVFGSDQFVDIIFLSDALRTVCRKQCESFYSAYQNHADIP
jgi:hypothetical protein